MKRAESYQWNRESDVPDEETTKFNNLLVKGRKNSPENAVAYATYESEMMILYPLQENRQPLELSDDFSGLIRICLNIWNKAILWPSCRWNLTVVFGMKLEI